MSILKKVLKLCFSNLVKILPVQASKVLYYKTFQKKLNLKKPQTINEKLMWLKLYEDDALKTKCADKYLVRDYIRKAGYSHILIDLYKVYENVEDINFQELPDQFVMKCTHASGFNIICKNKSEVDKRQTILQLKKWINTVYGNQYCEPHYSKIKPRIIVERFLENLDGHSPIDYMIHCFHGVPRVIEIGVDYGNNEKKYGTFNCNWDVLPYFEESVALSEVIKKPDGLQEMLEIARNLSEAFTYVRVDLYYINSKIYFGELTFTPGACLEKDFIHNADFEMGKLLNLTVLKKQSPSKSKSKVSIQNSLN